MRSTPAGAEAGPDGVDFRVWAPRRKRVQVVLVDRNGDECSRHDLQAEEQGYFAGLVPHAKAGDLYWFVLDDESKRYPDPASRHQPQGVHGPSEVVDWRSYGWQDEQWSGAELRGQVLYELHVGAFTPEGTFAAAMDHVAHLRDLGVTLIELMPVAEFQGDFGWGYDGVCWFAPTRLYGRPDDFRAFVDHAHQLGLGVILDVVYNHFGPTGNYLSAFSAHYASRKHTTEWGEAINFDGEAAGPVREFVASNAAHWIREYHLDGLRLDATQAIYDDSDEHILAVLTRAAREAAGGKPILIFAENEQQRIEHVEQPAPLPARSGYGMDGLWNDDFHHACRVAATGHAEFYYADYAGSPQELLSALRWGYLYQGQWTERQGRYRGTPSRHIAAPHFVHFLQNHDQVANSAKALRTHMLTSPGRYRALTALLLLGPQTPMLFMGQEFAASNPFLYFADHEVDIATLVREGRWEFLRAFPRTASFELGGLPDPAERRTFERSKLDWSEAERNAETLLLHRDLLHLRRADAVFARQDAGMLQGAVIGPEAFLLRWCDPQQNDRLLLVNLGRDFHWRPLAEPLSAPPAGRKWALLWSSDDPRYGGSGAAELDCRQWFVPGHAAVVLHPGDVSEDHPGGGHDPADRRV
ncbi:MAG TPA: malto-oligosyltrehalose trehalohydrolase [Lacipirellulaceae bacterium]|nr:malto-oligosyltrehalose trehalohydrolase [Lacipirellulaceae bacterium]